MADPKAPSSAGPSKPAPEPFVEQQCAEFTFTGGYAAIYLPPDRVSRWVQPGDVVDWGADGPPDQHWAPAQPAGTTTKEG
ncbi:MAG TPA: hypothetical protein VGJ13_05260 [Pseudonocardiaceae bacterium]|jgi:hypothetical protein